MRRIVILLVLLMTAVLSATPAGSAPVGPRTVEFPYTGVGEIQLLDLVEIHRECGQATRDLGGACFRTGNRDRFIQVEVADDTGLPIAFTVNQGQGPSLGTFCGSTSKPIPVRSHAKVAVVLGTTGCPSPSVPLRGVVRVTFSR